MSSSTRTAVLSPADSQAKPCAKAQRTGEITQKKYNLNVTVAGRSKLDFEISRLLYYEALP